MKESLFTTYVKKYFTGKFIGKLLIKINGKKEEPTYLFKQFFKKKYAPTLTFESLIGRGSVVAADVVATNSALSLKARDSFQKSTGDIPKIGMKLALRESEMNNIDNMMNQSNDSFATQIVQLLFGDTKKVIQGVYARLELMALQALSTGIISIDSTNNVGRSHRIVFAIPSGNQTGVATIWSDVASKPLDDIEGKLETAGANGDILKHILMSRTSFNQFKKTTQVKERYAAFLNLAGNKTIVPSLTKANEFMMEDYNMTILVIDKTVQIEKNGKKTVITPWEEGKVTLLPSLEVGDLAWGTTAEKRRPVAGVAYQDADDYILVSKFAKNEPLEEFTSAQAYAMPVLNDVESIYQMNTLNVTTWE